MALRIDAAGILWLGALGLLAAAVGLLAGIDPRLALLAAVGAGFVLLVFTDLAAGLAVFGFFGFLEVLELGSAISVGKLGGALLALGWLAALATRRQSDDDFLAAHPWASAALGLLLGWSLLSASWAPDSGAALGTTARLALNAVLFLIVFTAIRTRRHATQLTVAFVAGALAATAYGLLIAGGGRLAGADLDPNELASALVAGAALSGALAVGLRSSPGLRLAALGGAAFCVLGVFLTVSRGGALALGVTLVAALLLSGRWRPQAAAATMLILAGSFVYFGAVAPAQERERILSATQGETRLQDGRLTTWTVAWRMAEDRPVAGVGAGNFQEAAKSYLLRPGVLTRTDNVLSSAPKVAHNTYLGVLAELGAVGLALFLAVVAFSLSAALRAATRFAARGDRGGEALARGLAIALVGTLAADFFISQELNKQLWLLLGFGPALLAVSRKQGARAEGAAP